MSSTRSALFYSAAISFLLSAATAYASDNGTIGDSLPIMVAQVDAVPQTTAESPVESDPVSIAEQGVEDARVALRNAMATGGDVRGARRDLQTAIQHLNEVKVTAEASDKPSQNDSSETVETPILETPAGETPPLTPPQLVAPLEPPAELPSRAAPETFAATPPPPEPPALAAPTTPPVQLPTAALPQSPAIIPSLPLPGAPLTAADKEQPASASTSEEPAPETTVAAPPQMEPEKKESGETPGFFRRLFGGGKTEPEKAEEETAKSDDGATDHGKTNEPSLPIFRKLPPLQGPKVVTVAPGESEFVEEDDKRVIVKEGGRATIIHDDNDRFRRKGEDVKVEKGQDLTTVTTVTRGNGTEIVTQRDSSGDILQRYRKKNNGEIEMLIGDRDRPPRMGGAAPGAGQDRRVDFARSLPKLVVPIPRNQYILGSQGASRSQIEQALMAPPVEAVERPYSLQEIRRNERLRAKLRRIDIDTVTFDFGAATVGEDQIPNLQAIGNALSAIITDDPSQVFFIEGHTDAVGRDLTNLALSDRRAESIAEILTFYFNIPPENLITQGYGEQYLKVLTAGPERLNRRASVRRITPLLAGRL